MPITANFTITQGTDNSKITLTDTTIYDGGEPVGSMTSRTIILYKSDGTALGTYTFTGSNLTVQVSDLAKDYALRGVFTIVPPSVVGGSTYTVTRYAAVTGYSMTAFYNRHNRMAVNPRLEVNRDYVTDNYKILMEVKAAQAAVAQEDTVSAQLCLDRAKKIIDTNKLPY